MNDLPGNGAITARVVRAPHDIVAIDARPERNNPLLSLGKRAARLERHDCGRIAKPGLELLGDAIGDLRIARDPDQPLGAGTDLFNPNVIRASLGTVFSLPVAVASSGDVLEWLLSHQLRIIAARVEASLPYTDADLTGPVAIALGSEARGLSDAWAELAAVSVHVPMLGVADSLNVSATAAVLFYEALRQRRSTGTAA